MDNKVTQFEALLFNLSKMRADSRIIAKEMGFNSTREIDAFRHAYTSAKMKEVYGDNAADIAGIANELGRDKTAKLASLGIKGNPDNEWEMDLFNNEVGRRIQGSLSVDGLSDEEKELRLRQEITNAVKDGRLQVDKNIPHEDKNPHVQSSIMDYYRHAVDQMGDIFANIFKRR